MSMIKTPTIMKQNPLIFAEFEKAFSEVDHDIVNILLNELQNVNHVEDTKIDLFNYEKVFDRKVIISASKFKELGKFGKNSNQSIFESLKKISDTSAIIRNFRDKDNHFIRAQTVRIIDGIKMYGKGSLDDEREEAFEVQFNEWFLHTSTRQFNTQVGNFTKLQLNHVSELKGKHAKTLYELLKSQRDKRDAVSFSITLDLLQKLFNLDGQPLSKINAIIKRVKPKVEKHIPFSYTPFKKDKLISFVFEKK